MLLFLERPGDPSSALPLAHGVKRWVSEKGQNFMPRRDEQPRAPAQGSRAGADPRQVVLVTPEQLRAQRRQAAELQLARSLGMRIPGDKPDKR